MGFRVNPDFKKPIKIMVLGAKRVALVGCEINPGSWRLHATKHNKEIERVKRVLHFVGLLLLLL